MDIYCNGKGIDGAWNRVTIKIETHIGTFQYRVQSERILEIKKSFTFGSGPSGSVRYRGQLFFLI